jgi:phage terminase large subunit-like protein
VAELNVKLHPSQLEVFQSPKRFKVVAAGRRFGKSRLAAWTLLIAALQNTKRDKWIFYVAPTFQQAKDVMWVTLKELGAEVISAAHENTGVLTLINGSRIALKGSDRPDTLRGVGLAYCVVDEYADMKPFVWDQILRPTLADEKGGALFIGTPKGRNHFYDMFKRYEDNGDSEWDAFHFTSYDNPFLDRAEIDQARQNMSSFAFKQEFLASFEAASSTLFKEEWIKIDSEEPRQGSYYVAVDLAGFEDVAKTGAKKKKLDQTAIAIVKVNTDGWWVKEIQYGRWDIRECAVRILKAYRDYKPVAIGIEKGALKNAVLPYLSELMKRFNLYFAVHDLTHGNTKKTDRIVWALQGRMEHGRLSLCAGEWNSEFIDELLQFPDSKTHDDLVDALAYVAQLAEITFFQDAEIDEFEIMDETVGY